jgi:hypothetical protein
VEYVAALEDEMIFATSADGEPSAGESSLERFKCQLTTPMPSGWLAGEMLQLKSPTGASRLVVASDPVGKGVNAERFARDRGETLRQSAAEYRELEFVPAEIFGGHQGYLRRLELTGPNTEPKTHIELYCVEGGRAYVAIAMMPLSEIDSYERNMRLILDGIRIEPE